MTDKLTVSVLGTGIRGAAMARDLVRAGHTVRAWNRTRAKAEPPAADGAFVAGTPRRGGPGCRRRPAHAVRRPRDAGRHA
ncbi:NAD binding domain of 6-phosphogluconate dehydrogenase [Streptomyces sp. cf124]|nr:NAD binding domain of 6-phosphogluconate dehydrogenase [Streptomyces sp. cf124]